MRLFRFDRTVGHRIQKFDSSNFTLTPLVHLGSAARVSCTFIEPHGRIGYHQATAPQLFLVVQGQGWVQGNEDKRQPLGVGQAAFWEAGEWHESGTEVGMMAIIIECESLNPDRFLLEV